MHAPFVTWWSCKCRECKVRQLNFSKHPTFLESEKNSWRTVHLKVMRFSMIFMETTMICTCLAEAQTQRSCCAKSWDFPSFSKSPFSTSFWSISKGLGVLKSSADGLCILDICMINMSHTVYAACRMRACSNNQNFAGSVWEFMAQNSVMMNIMHELHMSVLCHHTCWWLEVFKKRISISS